jgi:hypothetical protein
MRPRHRLSALPSKRSPQEDCVVPGIPRPHGEQLRNVAGARTAVERLRAFQGIIRRLQTRGSATMGMRKARRSFLIRWRRWIVGEEAFPALIQDQMEQSRAARYQSTNCSPLDEATPSKRSLARLWLEHNWKARSLGVWSELTETSPAPVFPAMFNS